ncbi:MAG: hypothetical protein ACFFFO_14865 [Candidatus Thorarchaeota archaeon]
MVTMVTSRREKARRIVIVYVIIGAVFFLLYYYVLRQSDPENPIINTLFYVFLPAILAAIALVSDVVLEGLEMILERFSDRDVEFQDEDAVS